MLRRCLAILLLSCSAATYADLTVGLLTSRASEQTVEDWQPVLDDLAAATGQKVKGVVLTDHAELLRRLQSKEIQIARVDNKLALDAVEKANCEVFARLAITGGVSEYRSVMLVRKDSPIKNADQLLDMPKKLRYAGGKPGTTAEYLIPQYHLFMKRNVLSEQYFTQNMQVGTEDAFIALARKQVDVAVSNTVDLEQLKEKYPRDFSQMRVVWESPNFAFDPLIMRNDLPAAQKNTISQFFLDYGRKGANVAQAKQRLYYADQLSGFVRADNRTLRQVTDLQLFHDLFRLTFNNQLAADAKNAQQKAYYQRYNQLVGLLGGAK
ncbi:phosphate/phosphite/phosphonate ABC transporter substrate-binding protein [Chitinibacter bivalviorum]|uniref:Phosphate/phosphite/phosphonate ABC transporter substrate-binding protein n=1 Tax=Chitinibacter bivalviorum TaxID=2739434 RepID=A0A7H9BJH2_9NEIS|nr:phosphate/phosphite/phosphonate ABC transporter substrate-binding protein [Chitinibacter bivalviorum]QLG88398.1 phosphate/phosphite/phosphonate ABC transporter substrate-binding protein [Chitinibacter bivalviorum]